jgi:hypothetical protein
MLFPMTSRNQQLSSSNRQIFELSAVEIYPKGSFRPFMLLTTVRKNFLV